MTQDSPNRKYSIGFAGLGAIGSGIASNLLKGGHDLHLIAHRKRENVDRLSAAGATECASLSELAQASQIIMFCLPDSNAVESVVEQLLPSLKPGHSIIDTGTSQPESAERLHERLGARNIAFAESPVAGGAIQAQAGELGAMVGADPDVFAAIKPVIECFSNSIEHFGPVGRASRAKLISNHLVLNMAALVYETFGAAAASGIEWDKLYRPMLCGAGNSTVLQRIIGNAVEGDYEGYVFSVDHARKDLEYLEHLAGEFENEVRLSNSALKLFRSAARLGFGERMISELLRDDVRRILAADDAAHESR